MRRAIFASSSQATSLRRVLQALHEDLAQLWRLTDLAQIDARDPAHCARASRRRTGRTIGEYRRRCRLARRCVELRLDRELLTQLAARHGLADIARMTHEFREAAGIPSMPMAKGHRRSGSVDSAFSNRRVVRVSAANAGAGEASLETSWSGAKSTSAKKILPRSTRGSVPPWPFQAMPDPVQKRLEAELETLLRTASIGGRRST